MVREPQSGEKEHENELFSLFVISHSATHGGIQTIKRQMQPNAGSSFLHTHTSNALNMMVCIHTYGYVHVCAKSTRQQRISTHRHRYTTSLPLLPF